MGFTVKHKKSCGTITRSFTYTGDLAKCIEDAKKELEKKTTAKEREFLRWQADRAKAALDKYEGRISDLMAFIAVANQHLAEKWENEKEEHNGQTSID